MDYNKAIKKKQTKNINTKEEVLKNKRKNKTGGRSNGILNQIQEDLQKEFT